MVHARNNSELVLTAVMRQATAIAEEFIINEIDLLLKKIKEKAIAKAMVPIRNKLAAFENNWDYSIKRDLCIQLRMGPLTEEKKDE